MNIGNLGSYLPKLKPRTIESRAPERFRQYRTTGNGKIEVYLPPQRGDELRAKLLAAAKDRDTKLDTLAEARDKALKDVKADYDARLRNLDRENRQLQQKANEEFDAIEHALLSEYSQALSPEQVALLMTKPGEVVRMNSQAAGKPPSHDAVPAQANGGGK